MISTSSNPTVNQSDYQNYIIATDNQLLGVRQGGRGNSKQILTYADGTEWIFLSDQGQERFCGFLYLQQAMKDLQFSQVQAAENKMTFHGRKVIYLSKYCGENKVEFADNMKYSNELSKLQNDIGFTDTTANANLRKLDDKIYVFDTEKSSFKKEVHAKIDAFVQLHDAIQACLEAEMKDQ